MIRTLKEVEVLAVGVHADGTLSSAHIVRREEYSFGGGGGVETVCADAPRHRPAIDELPMFVDNDPARPVGLARFVVCRSCGDVLSKAGPGFWWAVRLWWRGLL